MRTEYWIFKENGEDFLEHLVICSFDKEIHAKLARWFMNKFGKDDQRFYYNKVQVGRRKYKK